MGYYVWTYNAQGNTETYCHYDPEGKLNWKTVYLYDTNGAFIGEEEYDDAGNLTSRTLYE